MLDISWGHLEWHANHINVTSHFITDYKRKHKTDPWTSSGSFDSTDSYAALFFLALDETYWAQVYIDGNDKNAKQKINKYFNFYIHTLFY